MRIIKIPVISREVRLFYGMKEYPAYQKAMVSMGDNEEDVKKIKGEDYFGHCYAEVLWVKNKDDIPTLIHELSHLIDNILSALNIRDGETRAYLLEWLIVEIIGGQKIPTRKEVEKAQDKFYQGFYKEVKS